MYWSTQLLTWLLIPFLSSYVQSGEFTILSKAKTALIDNAIYYGIYLIIFVILLVYAAASTTYDLSFAKLKIVGIAAANTWGLFLLGRLTNFFMEFFGVQRHFPYEKFGRNLATDFAPIFYPRKDSLGRFLGATKFLSIPRLDAILMTKV